MSHISKFQRSIYYQLINIQKRMQQFEYTPSICFNLEGTNNKEEMSAEFLFELSCTNQKQSIKTYQANVNKFNLNEQIMLYNPSKLKTEDFFEEFQQNFVVTFEDECPIVENICKSSAIKQYHDISQEKFAQMGIHFQDDIDKIDLCLLPQNSNPSNIKKDKKTTKTSEQSIMKAKLNSASTKQKDSPIQFEVKKRTVFKSKQNIASNSQHFKITKKKIINQDTIQFMAHQTKSCKNSKPKSARNKKSLTSQLVITKNKKSNVDFPYQNLKIDTNRTSTIFLEHKQARESFRSTTLDNWKRKFQIQRKGYQQKSKKSCNIFQHPFRF